jgi:flagellar hook-associated protein 2
LKDSAGNVVAVASTSGGSTASANWISIGSGGSYDTGRGLKISFFSSDGSYAATSAGTNAANVLYDNPILQAACHASLTVNGMSLTSPQNAGLTDVIGGVTLTVNGTGAAQVSVSNDDSAATTRVSDMLSKANDLLSYIKAKTRAQLNSSSGSNSKPSYTPAVLGNDFSLKSLRQNLVADLLSSYAGAEAGSPARLSDIGIRVDSSGSFTLSDQAALQTALDQNPEGVTDLLNFVLGKVQDRLNPFVDGSNAVVARSRASADTQLKTTNDRIQSTEAQLKTREDALRKQFQALQGQLLEWQNQGQYLGSLFNLLY